MRTLHARVHDIRKRITQQEVVIELRVPIELFPAVVAHLDDADVLVVARSETGVEETPYGYIDEDARGQDDESAQNR